MITEFLGSLGRSSGHWIIVVGIGFAFLAVQAALSARLFLRARRHDCALGRLCRDLQRGLSGRRDPDDIAESFAWLRWVLTVFPDEGESQGKFTRDEALHELDTHIASDASYLLLQRMGIMAPLLGVVLTVVGFYWLDVGGSGDQSLQTILAAVTPLVIGVGTGAVLALVNQALLQIVGSRLERLRMSARTWFDAAIWRHVGRDGEQTAAQAAAVVTQFAAATSATAGRHAESADQVAAATASLKVAASQFGRMVEALSGELRDLPQALCGLRDASAASVEALQELLPASARAVANLDVSVAAFRTTVDREFADAARLHERSAKLLAQSVEHIANAAEGLQTTTKELKLAVDANGDSLRTVQHALGGALDGLGGASERLRRTMESDVAPSQQCLHGAAESFAQSAAKLAEFINHGLDPATRDLATLHETLTGLQSTIESLQELGSSRADVDRLVDTLSRAAEISDAIAALPEQVRSILEDSAAQRYDHVRPPALMPWLLRRPR